MDNEKKEKIIMIVNGQPIEMCPKTLNMCNKRAQRMITALKTQSMEKVHTMRLFWGDVVMLNIITNQLLQKVDNRSLSRVLKPTESLQADLDEYKATRQQKADRLRDALITAMDDTLPLDYSRELEKYFYETPLVEEHTEELTIDKITIPNKETFDEKTIKNHQVQQDKNTKNNIQQRDKKVAMPTQKKPTTKNKNIYRSDDSEEEVDFSISIKSQKTSDTTYIHKEKSITENAEKSKKTEKVLKEPDISFSQNTYSTITNDTNEEDISTLFETKKSTDTAEEKVLKNTQPVKNEFERNQESFTSFGSIDLDSLFG